MGVHAIGSASGRQVSAGKAPSLAVRRDGAPPEGDSLSLSGRDDLRARSTLKAANDAAYNGDRSGADHLFREAGKQAATPDMARRVASDASYRGFKLAAAEAYRAAAALATDWQDVLRTANDAAYKGLVETADAAYRRASDLSTYSDSARRVASDADYKGYKEAADYSWRRSATLPPAPPAPPRPSLWSRIKAFFRNLFGGSK